MRGHIESLHPLPPKNAAVAIHVAAAPKNLERFMGKPLEITIEEYHEKRSLQANRFLWACIADICNAVNEDKDKVYLDLLRHYGQYTVVRIPAEALDILKRQWKEVEVVGEVDGKMDVLCYFGSHTYNSKEFARLLDGVKDMMRNAGLEAPPDAEMQEIINRMERKENAVRS